MRLGPKIHDFSTFGEICKWLKHADCKSVLYEFAGSNPALTTILRVVRKGGSFLVHSLRPNSHFALNEGD